MTAVATSQGANRVGELEALTGGYSAAFLGAAGVAVVGAVVAAALLRVPEPSAASSDGETGEELPMAA